MAKNERIIAQDLAELKYAIQTKNTQDIENLCNVLKREISKYPVKYDITNRLESLANYSKTFDVDSSIEEEIKEITNLIELLTSN